MAVWGGFSLDWYAKAWANEQVKDATLRSLVIACFAAVISTAVATMAALGTTRRRAFKGQTFIYVMINQPLMVPEIVTAVALMILFGLVKTGDRHPWPGLSDPGPCGLLRALRLSADPRPAGRHGPDAGNRGGRSLRHPWATFRRVTLPLLAPGHDGRGHAGLRHQPGRCGDHRIREIRRAGHLPTYMLGQLRRQLTPEINAVSTMLLAVTVVLLTAFFLLTRKKD
jgi:spermidine/putrescine transport system permease protein